MRKGPELSLSSFKQWLKHALKKYFSQVNGALFTTDDRQTVDQDIEAYLRQADRVSRSVAASFGVDIGDLVERQESLRQAFVSDPLTDDSLLQIGGFGGIYAGVHGAMQSEYGDQFKAAVKAGGDIRFLLPYGFNVDAKLREADVEYIIDQAIALNRHAFLLTAIQNKIEAIEQSENNSADIQDLINWLREQDIMGVADQLDSGSHVGAKSLSEVMLQKSQSGAFSTDKHVTMRFYLDSIAALYRLPTNLVEQACEPAEFEELVKNISEYNVKYASILRESVPDLSAVYQIEFYKRGVANLKSLMRDIDFCIDFPGYEVHREILQELRHELADNEAQSQDLQRQYNLALREIQKEKEQKRALLFGPIVKICNAYIAAKQNRHGTHKKSIAFEKLKNLCLVPLKPSDTLIGLYGDIKKMLTSPGGDVYELYRKRGVDFVNAYNVIIDHMNAKHDGKLSKEKQLELLKEDSRNADDYLKFKSKYAAMFSQKATRLHLSNHATLRQLSDLKPNEVAALKSSSQHDIVRLKSRWTAVSSDDDLDAYRGKTVKGARLKIQNPVNLSGIGFCDCYFLMSAAVADFTSCSLEGTTRIDHTSADGREFTVCISDKTLDRVCSSGSELIVDFVTQMDGGEGDEAAVITLNLNGLSADRVRAIQFNCPDNISLNVIGAKSDVLSVLQQHLARLNKVHCPQKIVLAGESNEDRLTFEHLESSGLRLSFANVGELDMRPGGLTAVVDTIIDNSRIGEINISGDHKEKLCQFSNVDCHTLNILSGAFVNLSFDNRGSANESGGVNVLSLCQSAVARVSLEGVQSSDHIELDHATLNLDVLSDVAIKSLNAVDSKIMIEAATSIGRLDFETAIFSGYDNPAHFLSKVGGLNITKNVTISGLNFQSADEVKAVIERVRREGSQLPITFDRCSFDAVEFCAAHADCLSHIRLVDCTNSSEISFVGGSTDEPLLVSNFHMNVQSDETAFPTNMFDAEGAASGLSVEEIQRQVTSMKVIADLRLKSTICATNVVFDHCDIRGSINKGAGACQQFVELSLVNSHNVRFNDCDLGLSLADSMVASRITCVGGRLDATLNGEAELSELALEQTQAKLHAKGSATLDVSSMVGDDTRLTLVAGGEASVSLCRVEQAGDINVVMLERASLHDLSVHNSVPGSVTFQTAGAVVDSVFDSDQISVVGHTGLIAACQFKNAKDGEVSLQSASLIGTAQSPAVFEVDELDMAPCIFEGNVYENFKAKKIRPGVVMSRTTERYLRRMYGDSYGTKKNLQGYLKERGDEVNVIVQEPIIEGPLAENRVDDATLLAYLRSGSSQDAVNYDRALRGCIVPKYLSDEARAAFSPEIDLPSALAFHYYAKIKLWLASGEGGSFMSDGLAKEEVEFLSELASKDDYKELHADMCQLWLDKEYSRDSEISFSVLVDIAQRKCQLVELETRSAESATTIPLSPPVQADSELAAKSRDLLWCVGEVLSGAKSSKSLTVQQLAQSCLLKNLYPVVLKLLSYRPTDSGQAKGKNKQQDLQRFLFDALGLDSVAIQQIRQHMMGKEVFPRLVYEVLSRKISDQARPDLYVMNVWNKFLGINQLGDLSTSLYDLQKKYIDKDVTLGGGQSKFIRLLSSVLPRVELSAADIKNQFNIKAEALKVKGTQRDTSALYEAQLHAVHAACAVLPATESAAVQHYLSSGSDASLAVVVDPFVRKILIERRIDLVENHAEKSMRSTQYALGVANAISILESYKPLRESGIGAEKLAFTKDATIALKAIGYSNESDMKLFHQALTLLSTIDRKDRSLSVKASLDALADRVENVTAATFMRSIDPPAIKRLFVGLKASRGNKGFGSKLQIAVQSLGTRLLQESTPALPQQVDQNFTRPDSYEVARDEAVMALKKYKPGAYVGVGLRKRHLTRALAKILQSVKSEHQMATFHSVLNELLYGEAEFGLTKTDLSVRSSSVPGLGDFIKKIKPDDLDHFRNPATNRGENSFKMAVRKACFNLENRNVTTIAEGYERVLQKALFTLKRGYKPRNMKATGAKKFNIATRLGGILESLARKSRLAALQNFNKFLKVIIKGGNETDTKAKLEELCVEVGIDSADVFVGVFDDDRFSESMRLIRTSSTRRNLGLKSTLTCMSEGLEFAVQSVDITPLSCVIDKQLDERCRAVLPVLVGGDGKGMHRFSDELVKIHVAQAAEISQPDRSSREESAAGRSRHLRSGSINSVMQVSTLEPDPLDLDDDEFQRVKSEHADEYSAFRETVRLSDGPIPFVEHFMRLYDLPDNQPARGRGGKQFAGNLKNHIKKDATPEQMCAEIFVAMYGVVGKGRRSNIAFQEVVEQINEDQVLLTAAPRRLGADL